MNRETQIRTLCAFADYNLILTIIQKKTVVTKKKFSIEKHMQVISHKSNSIVAQEMPPILLLNPICAQVCKSHLYAGDIIQFPNYS